LEDRTLPSAGWSTFGHDPQHTGDSAVASQPLDVIHWQTSIDLNNTGAFAHYGSPVITPANTVIIPVKTGANGGFELKAMNGATGSPLWTITSDYTLPPYSWIPPFDPALSSSNVLYFPGNGGTVYYVSNPDTPGATKSGQLAFYGIANYKAHPNEFNSSVEIDSPITSDNAGNIYFGFEVTGQNPLNLVGGGIARIDANGNGIYVLAGTAANDSKITKVQLGSAPALSSDGSTLYVAVNESTNYYGYLLGLDSTTLATKYQVFLTDPRFHAVNPAGVFDISTASPMVAPDGTVLMGIYANPDNSSRGFMLHFSGDLKTEYTPGAFGWDDTVSIVPTSMVPTYKGKSPYLIFTKYNNYVGFGNTSGDGVNQVSILDPYATERDPHNDNSPYFLVMNEVLTLTGPTPDPNYINQYPGAVREWCINDTVVDPATDSIIVNSEDGNVYRWNLRSRTISEGVKLTPGVGEPYVPTLIGPDGTIYALNGGTLFAIGGFANYSLAALSSLNPAGVNQSVTFTAAIASTNGGPAPTGTIIFEDGSTILGSVVLTQGKASLTTSFPTQENHFITALYSGDSNYAAGSMLFVQWVRDLSASAVVSSLNPSTFGQAVTFTATVTPVTSGNPTPSGRVYFVDGNSPLGFAALNSSGQATFTISTLSVGSHNITAFYDGSFQYIGSTSPVLVQVVNAGSVVDALSWGSYLNTSAGVNQKNGWLNTAPAWLDEWFTLEQS
jgi:hypothetical protein